MGVPENIKKIRERFDLTQQELADIAGVTNKAVSSWESGNAEPRMGAIERIARRFGLKKSNIIEDGGMDNIDSESGGFLATIADFSDEELLEITKFAEYIKSKRSL